VQSPLGDLFQMQDDIARRVVEGLSLPLAGERHSPNPDVPRSPEAYEFYLRGNGLARTYDGMKAAREQYEQCLELDPDFAPAWAHLGRCHRVIGRYRPAGQRRAGENARQGHPPQPAPVDRPRFYAN
jgi:hypothetical protein